MQKSIVWPQLLLQASAGGEELAWKPFRAGVEILPLYHNDSSECACALLRYQPGAQVPEHVHTGIEHLLILQGAQQDEHGHYPAGTLVINPVDTKHSVASPEGCIVLAVWEKPVRFTADAV